MEDLLQQGIIAYKAGKRDEARKIFIDVVKQSPNSESSWGWMYQASNNDQERIHCLKQVLRINPNNEKVKQLLSTLVVSDFPFEIAQKNESPIREQLKPVAPKENHGLIQQKRTSSKAGGLFLMFLTALLGIFLVVGGVWFYFTIIQPNKEPLHIDDSSKIIGIWERTENNYSPSKFEDGFFVVWSNQIEFFQDGTFLLPQGFPRENSGVYSLLENNRIKFELSRYMLVYEYKITDNRLIITIDGTQFEYTKK
jgi:tetratricopeptide (TPR) repeat protein